MCLPAADPMPLWSKRADLQFSAPSEIFSESDPCYDFHLKATTGEWCRMTKFKMKFLSENVLLIGKHCYFYTKELFLFKQAHFFHFIHHAIISIIMHFGCFDFHIPGSIRTIFIPRLLLHCAYMSIKQHCKFVSLCFLRTFKLKFNVFRRKIM